VPDERQQAPPLAYESRELLALTAYVRASHAPADRHRVDPSLQPFLDNGRAAFYRRQGQLNLACYQCHDENWGKRLAGNPSRSAPPRATVYRLEWQSLGSLQRRLRGC